MVLSPPYKSSSETLMNKEYLNIIKHIGEDPQREGLLKTADRAAEAMKFLTDGYRQNLEEVINDAVFTVEDNHMIIVKDIELYSLCEHHMLPFFGKCHIGYIPNGKVLGVSKLARIVDLFSRRLQIQERLTHQVAKTISTRLEADGVGVVIEAQHLCMMMRGVEKQNSNMVTSAMLGSFRRDASTRNEFLKLIGS
ncbi:MAG: GTP cyclohydrolase I FolE [Kiritimatiellaceae bacterium]|nr:GTP cyclohydrolase I FolE [Kiritimatiellaceae bacterium]MAW40751.1 GTP cyclohydrolase I FolE [Kiritimatiellaceae bacterium]